MEWLIVAGVVAALIPLGVLAQRKGWIDLSNKSRRGGGGPPLGAIDEVFHPTRYETQLEQDRQAVLPAPAPIPGDPADDNIYSGKVRLRIRGGRHVRVSESSALRTPDSSR